MPILTNIRATILGFWVRPDVAAACGEDQSCSVSSIEATRSRGADELPRRWPKGANRFRWGEHAGACWLAFCWRRSRSDSAKTDPGRSHRRSSDESTTTWRGARNNETATRYRCWQQVACWRACADDRGRPAARACGRAARSSPKSSRTRFPIWSACRCSSTGSREVGPLELSQFILNFQPVMPFEAEQALEHDRPSHHAVHRSAAVRRQWRGANGIGDIDRVSFLLTENTKAGSHGALDRYSPCRPAISRPSEADTGASVRRSSR
mgnify:CR=1 FL=1